MSPDAIHDALALSAEHGFSPVMTHNRLSIVTDDEFGISEAQLVELYRQGGVFSLGLSALEIQRDRVHTTFPDDLCWGTLEAWAWQHQLVQDTLRKHITTVFEDPQITEDTLTEEQRFSDIPGLLTSTDGLTVTPIEGYKYDAALNLLMKNLLPENTGLRGFVIAALFGAIVSSLAAVLNAASTIFTMDVYNKYIHRDASQKKLVSTGRIAVGVFALIGCGLAPNLDKFGSIFKYIQQFQGYASPGILAVFVFGLLNRRASGITGVVGLLLNPVLYWALDQYTNLAFLDAMGICFVTVLIVMWIIGILKPLPKPVEFKTNTTMNLETSRGARLVGIGVVIATLILYAVFW